MEFHMATCVIEFKKNQVWRNCMKFYAIVFCLIYVTPMGPWNSMEILISQFRLHKKTSAEFQRTSLTTRYLLFDFST